MTEETKMRKMRFWAGTSADGVETVTAKNKKVLREKIELSTLNYKGTKIRQFEVLFESWDDLASKLLGRNVNDLILADFANVCSEYDA